MKAALLSFAAVCLGLLVAFVLLVAVEFFGAIVHPLPEDFGGSMEEMCRHVQKYPHWILAVVVVAWAVVAFVSTWLAQQVGNAYSALIVGLILLAALVFNISQLPYPMWFRIANLLVVPTAIVTGRRLSTRHKTAGTGQAD